MEAGHSGSSPRIAVFIMADQTHTAKYVGLCGSARRTSDLQLPAHEIDCVMD
ncbi:unnamed protein product [Brassica rapa]|uniref:Uncharacterized protein n=2 Tax=Brassica TaxID=3705 RepID=A0A8D9GWZ8_BRACM|nr:unnamed protein product [Brassica napus]CAG7888541.1 unnamed protein product [Brassica rapa]